MDPVTAKLMSAAGAAEGKVYVDDVFSTFLYEGNGTSQTINNGIDVSGEGGLVWIKNREANASDHIFTDTERGTNTVLESNRARVAQSKTDMITSFNSNGFSIADNGNVNENNDGHCSWTFRKAKGFFDVLTYTGNGSHRDISHSLGSEPGSIWIKRTDGDESWIVYHRSLDQGGGSGGTAHMAGLELESTGAQYGGTLRWSASGGGEDHTATTFHVSGHSAINGSGMTYVAYIFAHDDQSFGTDEDESIIKCGSYTCDSSGGVAPIDLGFEPQWVLIKKTTGTKDWVLVDNMRRWTATTGCNGVYPNQSTAEGSFDFVLKLNSKGFQPFSSGLTQDPNDTYIYIAIRRPHKPPSAATDVFNSIFRSSTVPNFVSGFVTDLAIYYYLPGGSSVPWFFDRLRNKNKRLSSSSSAAESGTNITGDWDFNNGWGTGNSANSDVLSHTFRRAPGFFDMVAYSGNGSGTRHIDHNLGVVPEMMWVKLRNAGDNWAVYHSSQGNNKATRLNEDLAFSQVTFWDNTTPTSSVFTVDNDTSVNGSSYTYIAYLFATLPGISKVGSFSGTGNDINVDCGFTAGARFVMIKRTDSSGDWYVWDSARGIVAGNDPYVLLNSTAAQVTNTDYIDPLNAGFTVTSSAPAAINTSGGTYMFLAIA